jgi:hypothetical protein
MVVRRVLGAAFMLGTLSGMVRSVQAQQDTTDAERRARRQRQGAGLRVGLWNVTGLGSGSSWPMFEGYFQKGLDRHLALETTAGLWRRTQTTSSEEIRSFVVPMLTQLKFYPGTTVEQSIEPYVAAGIGLSLGIDNRKSSGGVIGGGGSSTTLTYGLGVRGLGGVELHLGSTLGIAGYAGYQYVYFLEPLVGRDSYGGVIVGVGLTYRYQY